MGNGNLSEDSKSPLSGRHTPSRIMQSRQSDHPSLPPPPPPPTSARTTTPPPRPPRPDELDGTRGVFPMGPYYVATDNVSPPATPGQQTYLGHFTQDTEQVSPISVCRSPAARSTPQNDFDSAVVYNEAEPIYGPRSVSSTPAKFYSREVQGQTGLNNKRESVGSRGLPGTNLRTGGVKRWMRRSDEGGRSGFD